MTDQVKRVYAFGKDAQGNNVTEGNTNMKAILGGKGANLAEMANIGLPVPPGFRSEPCGRVSSSALCANIARFFYAAAGRVG